MKHLTIAEHILDATPRSFRSSSLQNSKAEFRERDERDREFLIANLLFHLGIAPEKADNRTGISNEVDACGHQEIRSNASATSCSNLSHSSALNSASFGPVSGRGWIE